MLEETAYHKFEDNLPSVNSLLSDCHAALIAGTLVEGIGNRFSDVDVYIVCDELPKITEMSLADRIRWVNQNLSPACSNDPISHGYYYSDKWLCEVDIEFWTKEELKALPAKIDKLYCGLLHDVETIKGTLSFREKDLLHRVRNCHFISGKVFIDEFISSINYSKWQYVLYRSCAGDLATFKDAMGALESKNHVQLYDRCRDFILDQIQAIFFLSGIINPKRKWIPTYLPISSIPKGLATRIQEFLLPSSPITIQSVTSDFQALTIDLFAEARNLLDSNSEFPSAKDHIKIFQKDAGQIATDHKSFQIERDFRNLQFGVSDSFHHLTDIR